MWLVFFLNLDLSFRDEEDEEEEESEEETPVKVESLRVFSQCSLNVKRA